MFFFEKARYSKHMFQWFCPHTLGRYPILPQTSTKKEHLKSFINFWWSSETSGVSSRAYVAEILDTRVPRPPPQKKTPKDLPSLRKSWVLEKKQTQRAEELVVGARSTSTNLPGWNLGFLVGNLPTLKLTACPWKWMVGRWVSFWDPSYFQGRTVSFREGRGL